MAPLVQACTWAWAWNTLAHFEDIDTQSANSLAFLVRRYDAEECRCGRGCHAALRDLATRVCGHGVEELADEERAPYVRALGDGNAGRHIVDFISTTVAPSSSSGCSQFEYTVRGVPVCLSVFLTMRGWPKATYHRHKNEVLRSPTPTAAVFTDGRGTVHTDDITRAMERHIVRQGQRSVRCLNAA
jgi:hypothetical protein